MGCLSGCEYFRCRVCLQIDLAVFIGATAENQQSFVIPQQQPDDARCTITHQPSRHISVHRPPPHQPDCWPSRSHPPIKAPNQSYSVLLAFFATYPQSGLHRLTRPAPRALFASFSRYQNNLIAIIRVSNDALCSRNFPINHRSLSAS